VAGSHHLYARHGIPEQLNLQSSAVRPSRQLRQLVMLIRRYDLSIEEDK
jgi:hypothetical protein